MHRINRQFFNKIEKNIGLFGIGGPQPVKNQCPVLWPSPNGCAPQQVKLPNKVVPFLPGELLLSQRYIY